MKYLVLLTVCICWFVVAVCLFKAFAGAHLEAAITSPLIYNAYKNSQEWGTFTCVTKNSTDRDWLVDGMVHYLPFVIHTRLIQVSLDQSVIRIPAIPVNNRIAEIKCRAYTLNEHFIVVAEKESVETAQFNIQGLLDMPPNINYSSYNATHNLIEWQEPETLNVTNIEPDIENYTVCTNITDECFNISETYLIFHKHFVNIFLSVSAWNIVGESNGSAQLVIKSCNTTPTPASEDESYYIDLAFKEGNITVLTITFNSSLIKPNDIKSSLTEKCLYLFEINIHCQSSNSILSTHDLYGSYESIVLDLQLPKNQKYIVDVKRMTSSTNFFLNPINFSTYDVQHVTIRFEDEINIAFHLAAGAVLQGFTLQFVASNKTLYQLSFNINTDCDSTPLVRSCVIHKKVRFFDIEMLTLYILGWEEHLGAVYHEEFVLQFPATASTSADIKTSQITQPSLLIISTAMPGGGILGVGLICLVSTFLIRKWIKNKGNKSQKLRYQPERGSNIQICFNEAYSSALPMSENKAYEAMFKLRSTETNEPHTYDEVRNEPVYAEVKEK